MQKVIVQAHLDREWRHAEEYQTQFSELAEIAGIGSDEMISRVLASPGNRDLIMKACNLVYAQCRINIENRT